MGGDRMQQNEMKRKTEKEKKRRKKKDGMKMVQKEREREGGQNSWQIKRQGKYTNEQGKNLECETQTKKPKSKQETQRTKRYQKKRLNTEDSDSELNNELEVKD